MLLAATANITGNISDGIESLGKILNLKGKVLPLTEDKVTLIGETLNGHKMKGEHNITESKEIIIDVLYEEKPTVCER